MKSSKALIAISLLMFSLFCNANTVSYTGKIESIYLHDRGSSPYFGIELQGNLSSNPCGSSLKQFAISLADLNPHHLAMLLSAQMASRDVEISNADATNPCRGVVPTFNFVRVQ